MSPSLKLIKNAREMQNARELPCVFFKPFLINNSRAFLNYVQYWTVSPYFRRALRKCYHFYTLHMIYRHCIFCGAKARISSSYKCSYTSNFNCNICVPPPTNQLRLFSAAHLESVEAGGQLYLYSSGHPNGPVFMELAHQAGIFRAEIFLPLS